MEHLTGDDWEAFEKQHREAFYFLLHRSLMRERIALEIEKKSGRPLSEWKEKRLQELNHLRDMSIN